MIAIRQIHEQLASMIEVPVEIRNRRTEVIFLVVDGATKSRHEDSDGMDLTADLFFGALPDCRGLLKIWGCLGNKFIPVLFGRGGFEISFAE